MSLLSPRRAFSRARHGVVAAAIVAAAVVGVLRLAPQWRETGNLPSRLSHAAFWHVVSELSEPGASFMSANYVSNESSFQRVIPELQRRSRHGGVLWSAKSPRPSKYGRNSAQPACRSPVGRTVRSV
jgi:hypothetical protein